MTTRFFFLSVMVFFSPFQNLAFGQGDAIHLINPSFEDYPRAERVPNGWRDCGFPGESAPDTHPSGAFDVIKYPSDGNTYLGMVVRDNDTWERVSQQLTSSIQRGTCYSFSLNLCRSELYVSASRVSGVRANYVEPAKLVIWGGDGHCSKRERLAESPLISNTKWQPYIFKFEPKQSHTHITLEAFYKTPVLFPYNGNVLVDNASEIAPMPCDEEPIITKMPELEFLAPNNQPIVIDNQKFTIKANIKNSSEKINVIFKINGKPSNDFSFNPETGIVSGDIRKLRRGNNRIVFQATNKAGATEESAILIYDPQPKENAIAFQEPPIQPQIYDKPEEKKVIPPKLVQKNRKIKGYTKEQLTKGQIFKLTSLSFRMNDSTINQSAYIQLDEIFEFLQEHREVIVEIGGHTSGLCGDFYCKQLSTARAKAVAAYLKSKGIPNSQINYKGYGKTKPIASNNTTTGRRKNQRVEIKILSKDG